MKFILRKGTQILGTLFFTNNLYHFEGDQSFAAELATRVRSGIPTKLENYFDGIYTIHEEIIKSADERFPCALLDHLRNHGFGVEEVLEDIEHRFKTFMKLIPHESALYKNSMIEWDHLSHLEKTYLLSVIEKEVL